MKIAYLAENFGSFSQGNVPISALMHQSGHNIGNFAFWKAGSSLVDAEIRLFGFGAKRSQLHPDTDLIFIPAANFLNPTADLGWLAQLLREVNRPCMVLGLGAQSEREGALPVLKPGTVDFIREAATRTPFLALRGEFSRQVCEHYGVSNVKVLGCPSIFTNTDPKMSERVEAAWGQPVDKLAIHASSIKAHVRQAERMLFSLLAEHPGSSYIVQRPVELMKVIRGEVLNEKEQTYIDTVNQFLAPDLNPDRFRARVRAHGVIPYSVDSWIFSISGYSHSIGTRIHGASLSLAACLPTICITHDTRTRELCQVLKVPSIDCAKVRSHESVRDMFASVRFSADEFETNRSMLAHGYMDLLRTLEIPLSGVLKRYI